MIPMLYVTTPRVPTFVHERVMQRDRPAFTVAQFENIDVEQRLIGAMEAVNNDSIDGEDSDDDRCSFPPNWVAMRDAKSPEPAPVPHTEIPRGDYKGMYFFPGHSQFAIGLRYENSCWIYERSFVPRERVEHYKRRSRRNAEKSFDRPSGKDAGGSRRCGSDGAPDEIGPDTGSSEALPGRFSPEAGYS